LIDTGAPYPWKMKNVFVQFNEIADLHIGRWRGYWGMITDAEPDINYLNSGGRDSVSVFLDTEIRQGMVNTYGIGNSEDFAGCYALVFGRLKKSQRGKTYIRPHGISWICLNMPEDFIPRTTEEIVESSTTYDDVEHSNTAPAGEELIHPHDGSGEVCQAHSTPQPDIGFSDTVLDEEYETSQSEDTDSRCISGESYSVGNEVSHPQESTENFTTSEQLKTTQRGRITRWLRAIIFWKK